MKRSKSALLSPAEAAKAKEPETGPGSSTCFCRVMDRRTRAQEAHTALRAGQGGHISGQDGERFASFPISDVAALDEFYVAMKATVERGASYRVLVAALVVV